MRKLIHQTLFAHPQSVGESYFEHLRFALGFSGGLLWAGTAALIHALIPALCERTASEKIAELHNRMHNR
ncbi:MAG: DUF6356 family protein [Pseudomonadota bacterium]